jgi:hypothetical protein
MDAVAYLDMTFTAEKGQGRYWLLTQKGNPVLAAALSRLDLRMLERHSIPRILPLDVEEMNAEARLRYRLPVGLPLQSRFQAGGADAKLLMEVLLTIVTTLADSRVYLLDERKYALHPSLILIGESPRDIQMAYLPLRHLEQKPSLRHELYQLTLQLIEWGHIPLEECSVMVECLKSSLFELEDFKQLLIALQFSPAGQMAASQQAAAEEAYPADTPWHTPPPPSATEELRQRAELQDDGDTLRFEPAQWRLSSAAALRLTLVLMVVAWGAAAVFPSPVVMGSAGAVTLAGLILYIWSKRKEKEELLIEPDEEPDSWTPQPARPFLREQPDDHKEQEPAAARSFQWTEERNRLYRENPALTVLLEESAQSGPAVPPTELLLPETELLAPQAVLELLENEEVASSLPVSRTRFSFGRSPGEADCVLNASGISRIHGEIRREGELWMLCDLGSKNGTKLNGEPLIPHETYPLKNGDRITAAQTHLIFRIR